MDNIIIIPGLVVTAVSCIHIVYTTGGAFKAYNSTIIRIILGHLTTSALITVDYYVQEKLGIGPVEDGDATVVIKDTLVYYDEPNITA